MSDITIADVAKYLGVSKSTVSRYVRQGRFKIGKPECLADLVVRTVKVKKDNECWYWPGAHTNGGYPMVGFQGKTTGAYKVSYELRYGPFPEGYEADHLCCNAGCWNPDHIRPVTHHTNIRMSPNQHSRKTRCINGHLLEGGNIQARRDRRICLTCRRERENRYYRLRGKTA